LTKPGKKINRRLSCERPNAICQKADQREEPPLLEAVRIYFDATREAKTVDVFLFLRWYALIASGDAEERRRGLPQLMAANKASR